MRQLINNYTFTAGTREITIQSAYQIGVHNVRLIVNETQKVVICSSMQKDNISIANNVITYSSSLPALASGDSITIEIDLGEDLNASMNDIILRAKIDGVNGTPFSITLGSYLETALSTILKINNNGQISGFISAYLKDTAITALELSVSGVFGPFLFRDASLNCPLLTEVNIPNVTGNSSWQYGGRNAFTGCNALRKLTCDPSYVSGSDDQSNLADAVPHLETLFLSRDVSNNIYTRSAYLTPASVQNILEHCCNNNMSGKTITFYSGGLTVQDDADGTLQTLYNSVVNTYGATIANLTITPYSA